MIRVLQNRKGVTLLEGLIALALLAMVAVGTFGVLLSSSRGSTAPDKREEMLLTAERIRNGMQMLSYQFDKYTSQRYNGVYNNTNTTAVVPPATYPPKPEGYLKDALIGNEYDEDDTGLDGNLGFWNYLFNRMGRSSDDSFSISTKSQDYGRSTTDLVPVVCNNLAKSYVKITMPYYTTGSNRTRENLFWYSAIPADDAPGLKEMHDLYGGSGNNFKGGLVSPDANNGEQLKTSLILRRIEIHCDDE